VERFVALRQQAEQPQPSQPIVPQSVKAVRVVMPSAPSVRALDRDEIAVLYDRSQALIEQGDIASARLMLTRAAEAGDARAALALGTTYDPDVLRKLGVIGVAPDAAQAHAWYTKAVELGSPDAALRLERLAQAGR
jgi:TPR repeat protein